VIGGLIPIGEPNSTGELVIARQPIWRMGIRANSEHQQAAWEFIRSYILNVNKGAYLDGFPIISSQFEDDINEAFRIGAFSTDGYIGNYNVLEVPAFTQERAALLRHIMESITHENLTDPHIFNIVWEEASPFFQGARSAEDAARVIQSRVSVYLSEQVG